ncbi:MAG: hypothetical protein ACI8PZ_000532 [Myxococcota bacterium]|jgi:hypothetical protein
MWWLLLACGGEPKPVDRGVDSAFETTTTVDSGGEGPLPCGDCVGWYALDCTGAEAAVAVHREGGLPVGTADALSVGCDGVSGDAADRVAALGAMACDGVSDEVCAGWTDATVRALTDAADHGLPETLELYNVRVSDPWTWARWFLALDDGHSEWWETRDTPQGLRFVRYDAAGTVEAQGSRIGPRAADLTGCTWTSDHLAAGDRASATALSLAWTEVRTWTCVEGERSMTVEAVYTVHTATR